MQKLHQSVTIKANKQKVWNTIIDPQKYKQWASVFSEGSYFEGGWNKGDKIKFSASNQNSGMLSVIAENKPFEFISINHLGMIINGVEDYESEEVKKWTPAFENYTFIEESPEITKFVVDMDVAEGYLDEMNTMWEKGLVSLKELAEKPFESLTVKTTVAKPLAEVWKCYTTPKDVQNWNFASPDWYCPKAENDLRVEGSFAYTMAAKDGSFSFDFGGTYTKVQNQKLIEYILDDGRKVAITFEQNGVVVEVTTKFEAETQNPLEMQQQGWQAILDNFAKYCEKN